MTASCAHCGTPVDLATAYRRVQGWERKALSSTTRRGGSDVVLREQLDEWACLRCVNRLRSGLSLEQEALL